LTIIETTIEPDAVSVPTSSMVGKGSYIAMASGRALMAQRNPDGSIRVYAAVTVPDDWVSVSEYSWSDIGGFKQKILEQYFKDWAENVKSLVVESGQNEVRFWPLYDTPKPSEGGQWEIDKCITLIGDAAHVMPPWTGRGVNMALLDGLELGNKLREVLYREHVSKEEMPALLAQAMRDYEKDMWARMQKEKIANRRSQELMFSVNSPKTFQEMMKNGLEVWPVLSTI
jgi:2-polyprenyl-6-methoxyphenol hydroxylase-like FAD-dependent oxidoreductase